MEKLLLDAKQSIYFYYYLDLSSRHPKRLAGDFLRSSGLTEISAPTTLDKLCWKMHKNIKS